MYLTRNQAYRKVPWVRIPPSPPDSKQRRPFRGVFHFYIPKSVPKFFGFTRLDCILGRQKNGLNCRQIAAHLYDEGVTVWADACAAGVLLHNGAQ